MKFSNSGNTSITSNDIIRPISLFFGENACILSTDISDREPSNLSASLKTSENQVIIKPDVLNKGDSITLKTVVSDFDGNLALDARIIGVKEIRKLDVSTRQIMANLIAVIIGLFIILIGQILGLPTISSLLSGFGLGMGGGSALEIAYIFLKRRKKE